MPSPSLGWFQEANTNLNLVSTGSPQFHNIIAAWCGGTIDTLRSRMFVWGGGHGDGADNSLYVVNFAGTPSVERHTLPTAAGCSLYSCDGGVTPNARHTYHVMAYWPNHDAVWVYGGAPAGTGFATHDAWLFFCATKTWQYMNPVTSGPLSQFSYPTSCYDSANGRIYTWDNTSLYSATYNSGTGVLTSVGRWVNENGYHPSQPTSSCIDLTRRRMYVYCSGHASQMVYLDCDTTSPTDPRHTFTPTGATGIIGGPAPGMVYDAANDRIVMWNGGTTIYFLNPATHVITSEVHSGGPGAGQVNGTYNRFGYLPALGVYAVVNSVSQNAYTLRLTSGAADSTPPTAPSDLSATAASASRINLSWTASTDAVGVAHYLIERCSGSGCSSFTQIASVTTTSHADLELTAGTLYRYRVRADDAAGNLSSYSSIAQATTTAADVTAPSAPSDFTATTQSYTQINLSWTASTDNVAVQGYYIERCSGASCSNFVQIGTLIVGTSYQDLGLAASTLYRYRVRAVDTSSNLSSYSSIASATTTASNVRQVGSGKAYTTLAAVAAAAVSGDIIEVDPETYTNDTATFTQNDITIRGMGTVVPGVSGYAKFVWDTGDWHTATNNIPNGQGILRLLGQRYTIEKLEFCGAKVEDENGAGIRYAGNINTTIRNCYFHDNENGVLTANNGGLLTIQNCVAERNGRASSGGAGHNFYIGHIERLDFRYNKSVNPEEGHCLKARADYNIIEYNYFSTKDSDGSYELEFPWGGVCIAKGNVFEQGTGTSNSTFISYAAEGLLNTVDNIRALYVVNNTFYSWRSPAGTFIQMHNAPTVYKAMNNARNATNTFRVGTATTITETNNVVLTDADWVNVNTGDFHLVTGAAAINAGAYPGSTDSSEQVALSPDREYVATASSIVRTQQGAQLDAGAYEFNSPQAARLALIFR